MPAKSGNATPDSAISTNEHNRPKDEIGNKLYIWWLIAAIVIILAYMGSVLYAANEFFSNDANKPQIFPEILGLSPTIRACYQANTIVTSLIIALALGAAIGITYIIGSFLYKKFRDSNIAERQVFWANISERVKKNIGDDTTEIISGFRLYETVILDRRNTYWALFLRTTLAVIVVGVISLLMASCKIEAQAGLPIITGIISFVIGQGAEAIHGGGSTVLVIPNKPVTKQGSDDSVNQ